MSYKRKSILVLIPAFFVFLSTSSQATAATQLPSAPLLDQCVAASESLSFNVAIKDNSKDVDSDVTFTFTQPLDEKIPSGVNVEIPAGWNMPDGNSLSDGEKVGEGCLSFVFDGNQGTTPVTVVNDKDTKGHRASWRILFGNSSSPDAVLDSFIDGNPGQGYVWTIDRKFLFDIKPPITFNVTLFAKNVGKGQNAGDFVFKGIVKFVGGVTSTLTKILSLF